MWFRKRKTTENPLLMLLKFIVELTTAAFLQVPSATFPCPAVLSRSYVREGGSGIHVLLLQGFLDRLAGGW